MALKINPFTGDLDVVIGPGSGPSATDFATDAGTAIPTGAGVITFAGGTGLSTSGAINTVTIALDTPVTVPNGGTGATSLTDGGVVVGSGTGAVTVLGQATNGQLVIGSSGADPVLSTLTAGAGITITNAGGSITIGTTGGGISIDSISPDSGTDPVVPDGAGLITIIGSGSTTTVGGTNQLTMQLTGLTNHAVLVGAGTTTMTKVGPDAASGIPLISAGASADPAFGTAVVAGGGTGATSLTDGGVVLGSGTGAVTVLGQATNGQLVVGSTGADPVIASLTAPAAGITITGGAGTVTFALADDLAAAEGLSGTGLLSRTAANTWADTAITDNAFVLGDAGEIPQMLGPATAGQIPVGVTSGTPNLIDAWMQAGVNCWFWNLSFTHSAGVLTIAGADGTAISATNPGYMAMPSNATAGRIVIHTIVDPDLLTLSVSDMTGNTFGTTASVAWASSMPWYIGFMADSSDANLQPVVLRLPALEVSPSAAADIGDPSAANADKEYSPFCFNDLVEANYLSMQIGIIGSLTATKDASDDWTMDALTDVDGAGKFQQGSKGFAVPAGQNGSVSGTFINDTGSGTHPIFTTQSLSYKIGLDGFITFELSLTTCTTPGVGTNAFQPILPFTNNGYGAWESTDGIWVDNSGSDAKFGRYLVISSASLFINEVWSSGGGTSLFKLESMDSSDSFYAWGRYPTWTPALI